MPHSQLKTHSQFIFSIKYINTKRTGDILELKSLFNTEKSLKKIFLIYNAQSTVKLSLTIENLVSFMTLIFPAENSLIQLFVLYGLLSHVCHAGVKNSFFMKFFGDPISTMENFLKPFLEEGVPYSLGKVPVCSDGHAEPNIKFLQKVLFKHDVLVELKQILRSVCSPEPFTVKNDMINKLIKRLSEFLLSDEDVKIKADVFSYIFQSFAAICKGDGSEHIIQFFIVLSCILGMDEVPNVNKENADDCSQLINVENFETVFQVDLSLQSPESFLIFKELLLRLSKTSVKLNSPENQSYYKWLQQLLKNLANSQPFQSIFMEIFLAVADIDLKLLEKNLDYIFCNILIQGVSVEDKFWDSYHIFLERSLSTFAKFQRIVKFITKFLSSVKITPTTLVKEVILPLNVIDEFSKTVKVASNQQSLSLLDVLVEHLDDCFNNIMQENLGSKGLLLVTSELLICFFKEVKLFAPSIAFSTLQMFISKLDIFKGTLQKFGNYLFSNKTFILKNEDVLEVFLELCFYCGEIQTLINCYKDSILQPSDITESTADCDWQCCLSLDQWNKLVNYVLKSKLSTCSQVCFQLALQNLRICKLENKSFQTDEATLKIIMNQMTTDFVKFNAFQQVPPEDLVILMEILTDKQSKSVSRNILKQILENQNRVEWMSWLSNSTLQENSVFTERLFSELLNEAGSVLRDVADEKHNSKVSWISGEYFSGQNCTREECLEQLPEKINYLLRNVKKIKKAIRINAEQKNTLVRIVEVCKLLPLPHMGDDVRKLGLSFAVGLGTFLTDNESLVLESIYNFLACDMDASTCFDIGSCIKWLSELSDDNKMKVIESLVRNSPNMKFGLDQMGEMIESMEMSKHGTPMKALETPVVLYNELGKCWQRAKKRKSDNDTIGSYRTKLAKLITEEAKHLEDANINAENRKLLLKILAIELNKAIKTDDDTEMANLIEQKFPPYFDFAVKNLKKDFDEPSASFLTVILQSMPRLRKFLPQDSLWKIWKALRFHEKGNWRFFPNHSTDEEFNEILADLLKITKKFLVFSESSKHSGNCFEIWVSFFESSPQSKRDSCQVRLQELFQYVHECHLLLRDLPINRKLFLIKFFAFCLTNKEVVVTSHVLDTIIQVILECLDESLSIDDFHGLFTEEVQVASAILLRQFAWSRSKVHLTFVIFKRLLGSLTSRCHAADQLVKEDVIKLSTCAFGLEKWASFVIKREKDFARTSAYFITALISSIATVTVLPAVKCHLINCINHFLSISDSHTVAYLMRILKPGYQQVFNTVYNQFRKYHKYSGKI